MINIQINYVSLPKEKDRIHFTNPEPFHDKKNSANKEEKVEI